jgi:DNA gyrase subunit A
MKNINYLNEILEKEELVLKIIKEELIEIKNKFGDERRTAIEKNNNEIDIEDLIQEQQVVITLTHTGYIKRITADTYSAQKRGGKGIQAMSTKEDDFVEHMFITSTHNNILFFTNRGRVYKLKGYEIPDAGRTAKGTNLINLIPIEANEKIQAVIAFKEFDENNYFIMGTKEGLIKKTKISQYSSIRKNGLNAINLKDGDELIGVKMTTGKSEIIIFTKNGYAIRFNEADVRSMGRTATGVRAISFRKGDIAVTMDIVAQEHDVLVISENGFGKRTPVSEYTPHRRGGKGMITYKVTEKTGPIVGAGVVKDDDEMMLINSSNVAIRLNVAGISTTSRNTMGVTLMRTEENQKVVAIAKINCVEEIENDDEKIQLTSDDGVHND